MGQNPKTRIVKLWLILFFVSEIGGLGIVCLLNSIEKISVIGKILWLAWSMILPFIIIKVIIPKTIKKK